MRARPRRTAGWAESGACSAPPLHPIHYATFAIPVATSGSVARDSPGLARKTRGCRAQAWAVSVPGCAVLRTTRRGVGHDTAGVAVEPRRTRAQATMPCARVSEALRPSLSLLAREVRQCRARHPPWSRAGIGSLVAGLNIASALSGLALHAGPCCLAAKTAPVPACCLAGSPRGGPVPIGKMIAAAGFSRCGSGRIRDA